MSDDAKKEIPEFLPPDLPVLLVDSLRIIGRKDGFQFIQVGTMLPDGIHWQARFMVPDEKLRNMIDVVCSHSGYYPEKTSK